MKKILYGIVMAIIIVATGILMVKLNTKKARVDQQKLKKFSIFFLFGYASVKILRKCIIYFNNYVIIN